MMAPDPGQTQWAPGKLWSLWDIMQRLRLDAFWHSASEFADSVATVYFAESETDDAGRELTDDEKVALTARLNRLRGLCDVAGLTASYRLLGFALDALPTSAGEMNMLWRSVLSEMKDKLFLQVPSHLAAFYERDEVMREDARLAFPQASQELRAAGSAIACGLATASIFHCMRGLEHGLLALAADVKVTPNGIDNWHNVIDQIEKAIRKAGDELPRGEKKSGRMQFLSEAASEFRHFKDAWRNHVSHNKMTYTEPQALKAIEHVTGFIETLSAHLKEP
jgi:hypothetical protein